MKKTENEWRELLNPEEYHVLREKGTERPYTGEYVDHKEDGSYVCAGCGNLLFSSENKFDSGCGWPSFDDVMNLDSVITEKDERHGMLRSEILCKQCYGHLGHVFPDGPRETTGQRYCINSLALKFKKNE